MFYRETVIHCITAIIIAMLVIAGVVSLVFINSKKEHFPSAEEKYAAECAQRGGNAVTKIGWDNDIHVQEFKCEGVK